jgi:hypothetical protein
MKQLSLFKGIDYLAKLPGDRCVKIYWEPSTGLFYVVDCFDDLGDEAIAGVPDTAHKICTGQPEKFF